MSTAIGFDFLAKVIADRPHAEESARLAQARLADVEDAEALLVFHPHIDIDRARRRVVELATLADAPELVESFDAIATRARGTAQKPPGIGGSVDAGVKGRRRRS